MDTDKLRTAATRHIEKGQLSQAIAEYEKLVAANRADNRARLELADLLGRASHPKRAAEMWLEAARHYEEGGAALKAFGVYLQVVRADPRNHVAHLALGRHYLQHDLLSDAARCFDRALEYAPADDKMVRLEIASAMLERDPDNLRDRLRLAEELSVVGQTETAARELRRVLDGLQGRDADQAYSVVAERLLHHEPGHPDVALRLGAFYLSIDQAQRALPKLGLAYQQSPSDVRVLGLLSECFDLLGQVHKAVAVLKELARIYDSKGLILERDECYQRILVLDPNDRSARSALGGASTDDVGQLLELTGPAPVSPPVQLTPVGSGEPRAPASQAPPLVDDDDFDFDFDDDDEIGFADGAENTIVDDAFIPDNVRGHVAGDPGLSLTLPGTAGDISSRSSELQEDLRELDFYINNGLVDEADALVAELRERHGAHPLLDRRAQQVDRLR